VTYEAVPLGALLTESTELQGARPGLEPLTLTEGRGFILQRDKFKKRVALENTATYKVVRRGAIAFNPYLLWAGAIAQNNQWDEAVVSPAYPVFLPTGRAETRYLWHMLQSPLAGAKFDTISFGAIPRRRRAATSDFLKVTVPLPPLPEQRRIAAILDEADTLRRSRCRARVAMNRAIDARISELLNRAGDRRTLGSLIGEPLRNGISPSRTGTVEADVLTLSAITRGSFNARFRKTDTFASPHSADKLVTAGLHLICRGNGNADLVGVMAVAPSTLEGVAFPDTMMGMRPSDEINSASLLAAWRHDSVREQIRRGARTTNGTYKVNQQLLSSIEVPLPSRDAQIEIADLERARIDVDEKMASSLKSLDSLFASLQHRAFRGEL
jgi:type I restriction enzyme S subunit